MSAYVPTAFVVGFALAWWWRGHVERARQIWGELTRRDEQ